MSTAAAAPPALVVSGDAHIERLLGARGVVVIPAQACRLDGFVNDTFTEYANSSVYRPASVCGARLVSTLQDVIRASGNFYLGFTMYAEAGRDEPVEMRIGHLSVAHARVAPPDNRLHLFVAPERARFRGGERVQLVTGATEGPCRIEHLVLLPRRPRPSPQELEVLHPHVDLSRTGPAVEARITWITNRPARGHLRWRQGRAKWRQVGIPGPAVSHEIVLDSLAPGRSHAYDIRLEDETGVLDVAHHGSFRTDMAVPVSRTRRASLALQGRRSGPSAWPVSVGVPFPRGAVGSTTQLRLLDGRRRELPLQARPLALWPDDSVRWALLDFEGDGREGLSVQYGRDVCPEPVPTPLTATPSETGIAVNTGPMRVDFPRDATVLPGLVSLRQGDGTYRALTPTDARPAVRVVADDGADDSRVYEAGAPESVELEEAGPMRACVQIVVPHLNAAGATLFRSIFRVHLFRGRDLVRVLHTFENDVTQEEFTCIRALEVRADFDVGGAPQARLGRHRCRAAKTRSLSLQQTHDNRFTVMLGRQTLQRGRRADGRAELHGEEARVTLALRDFWQNYPKGIEVDARGIALQICPPLAPDAYPRGGEEEDRLYYYLLDGKYRLRCGTARTCEFYFGFGQGTSAAVMVSNAQTPPLYSVSLPAFNRSRALTRLPAKDPSPYPPYEQWVEAAQSAYAEDRRESRAYGMLNYGDWFGERTYNWGNQEYDAAWCFLQEYLRGGHPDFYTWSEEAARHLADVDTCHHSPRREAIGEQYVHCVGHVGGYYPEGYRERAIFTGRWSPSHTWVEGLFLYHLLSGDERARECAFKTCDLLVGDLLNHYDFTNCRNSGWHLIHLSAAYRATGRRVYLNAARIVVERVLERQRASGGWDRLMVPGHCYCTPPRHTGNAGFMVGVLMVGLKRYHEATGDRRVARTIVRAADYCIDTMWVPEKRAFRYTCCPHSSVGGGADMRILKGVAAAYRFSREPRFQEVLLAGVQSAMERGLPRAHRGVGKSICSPMRGAPQVLVELEKRVT